MDFNECVSCIARAFGITLTTYARAAFISQSKIDSTNNNSNRKNYARYELKQAKQNSVRTNIIAYNLRT